MREEVFIVSSAWQALSQVAPFLRSLTFQYPWRITFREVEPGSRIDQQRALRDIEGRIAKHTGEEPDRVHDELLKKHYGTVRVDLGEGHVWECPARRTRTGENPLSESEMAEHLEFVRAEAADLGIQLPVRSW